MVADMAYFTADDDSPGQVSREAVRAADVYVAIVGFRYGTPVRDQPDVCHTELEFAEATAAGMPRRVFLLSETTVGPAELFLDLRFGNRQAAFRARPNESGVTTATVTSPAELSEKLYQALRELPAARTAGVPVGRVWNLPAHSGHAQILHRAMQKLRDPCLRLLLRHGRYVQRCKYQGRLARRGHG